ncbi:hypothetical protein ZWY2020_031331 [Hordeum vulgare]|nr:hypothetical protein ZWY2020_031331 [Hordeum vulgare]
MDVNWAALPTDLLSCVGALLAVPARICFRAVCRTWREAIPEEQARAMPAPWVIVPRVDGCTDSFLVLSALTMNSFRWTPPDGARARCVGSNGTWLIRDRAYYSLKLSIVIVSSVLLNFVHRPIIIFAIEEDPWVSCSLIRCLLPSSTRKLAGS